MQPVVSREEWLKARRDLLAKEKEFTRLQDAINRARRALPWVRVDKDYMFDGPDGRERLADLFDGRSQLIVYHFMFAPEAGQGCPHCSLRADGFDGINIHLKQRDVVVLTSAPSPRVSRGEGWGEGWSRRNRSQQVSADGLNPYHLRNSATERSN